MPDSAHIFHPQDLCLKEGSCQRLFGQKRESQKNATVVCCPRLVFEGKLRGRTELPDVTVATSGAAYGKKLLVQPDIKNPDPAVYQLKGPKSNNISVCLYTDFQMNTTKDSEPTVFSLSRTVFNSNTTVLDMGAVGSKSNGLVAWSKSTDFECQSTFQQEFYPNSGISCDAKLVEKSFETDMNLNLQNLSVMGFRIILLKMVGFNLLMTLRLWSS